MRRIVGLDMSLTSTGIAIVTGGELAHLHSVKSTGKKADDLQQRSDRLYAIANEVEDHAWAFGMPDLVVIEAPSYGSKFGHPHDRSGLWWIVVHAMHNRGIPVAQVAPQGRAKYGTGKGNSAKDVVKAHVLECYSDIAPRRIKNDDECDAIILAAMGARHLGTPIDTGFVDEANLAAMEGVLWPSLTDAGSRRK